jgi:hypothetical protein
MTYLLGQEGVRYHGDKLRAYYGDEKYEKRYQTGINMMSAGVTLASGYGMASSLFGTSLGKGRYTSSMFAPLGASSAARLGRRVGKVGGQIKAASVARNKYMTAIGETSVLRKRLEAQASTSVGRLGMGHTLGRSTIFQADVLKAKRRASALKGRYTRASGNLGGAIYNALVGPIGSGTSRRRSLGNMLKSKSFSLKSLDPAEWSRKTLLNTGLMSIGAGAIAGNIHSAGKYQYPLMEAGNISMAPSATQRMNFSTAGLTQALHDKRRAF